MAKRVLLVGCQGFVGRHVLQALHAAGWSVYGYDLAADCTDARLDHYFCGQLQDRACLDAALAHTKANLVVSLAAYNAGDGMVSSSEQDDDQAIQVNALGLKTLLDAARQASVARVLWASSTVVYGAAGRYPPGPVNEDAPCRPLLSYGLSKVLAEQIACFQRDRYGLEVCGLRLPLVFGPGRWYRGALGSLADVFAQAGPGRKLRLDGPSEPFDFLYAVDAGRAFAAAADCPKPLAAVYNVAGFVTDYEAIASALEQRFEGLQIERHLSPSDWVLPLLDGHYFQHDTGVQAAFDLARAVDDFLHHAGAPS